MCGGGLGTEDVLRYPNYQKLLRHKDLHTTMTYNHGLIQQRGGVRSPADALLGLPVVAR